MTEKYGVITYGTGFSKFGPQKVINHLVKDGKTFADDPSKANLDGHVDSSISIQSGLARNALAKR